MLVASAAFLLAQGFGSPPADITKGDPSAEAAVERMARVYAALRTFRCFAVGSVEAHPARAEVLYDRAGTSLVRRLEPRKEGILAESHAWGEKIVVGSPRNAARYLSTHFAAFRDAPKPVGFVVASPPATPFAQIEAWAGLRTSGLSALIDGTFPRPFGLGGAILRDGGKAVAADGTPVEVVRASSGVFAATGRIAWETPVAVLQIGVADGLLRRVEVPIATPWGHPLTTWWEFRQVRADVPIPSTAFAFRPAKGAKPAPLPWETPPEDRGRARIRARIANALRPLATVRFRTEWRRTFGPPDGRDHRTPRDETGSSRFAWQRPYGFQGEVRWLEFGDWRRLTLRTEGDTLDLKEDDVAQDTRLPIGRGEPLWRYGGPSGVPECARGAALFLREIVADTGSGVGSGLGDLTAVAPRILNGERVDVLKKRSEYSDEYGIPDGSVFIERLYLGAKDALPRLYERVQITTSEDVAREARTIERFFDLATTRRAAPGRASRG